jgi:cytochrome c2
MSFDLLVEVTLMRKSTLVLLLGLLLALAACGGGGDDSGAAEEAAAPAGDAANGETLYRGTTIGSASAPGCVTCHSTEPGVVLVGPSHAGVGARAATAVSGMSAEEYLRESIVNPNAVVTEGFAEGVMYQNYGTDLTDQQISDLVAFLLTLQ